MVVWFVRMLAASAVALLVTLPAMAAEGRARAVVTAFHLSLLDTMKQAGKLGFRGRYRAIAPALEKAFDLRIMTRIIAGRYWRKFTPAQKKALTEAFSRMTKATYAHRFDGYSGETFRIVGEVPVRAKTLLIKAHISKQDGEKVKLDYLLREFKSGWRVVDIYLKGSISELATRRSEYTSVLRRQGLEALLHSIDKKVARYESGGSGE